MSVVHAGGGEKVVVRARGVVAVMMVVGDKRSSRESGESGEEDECFLRGTVSLAKRLALNFVGGILHGSTGSAVLRMRIILGPSWY